MRPFHAITAVLLVSFSLAVSSPAQVATDPVGFTTLTVNAKPASIRGFTFLSLDLVPLQVFQGVVPAVSTNGSNQTVLTFPAGTFPAAGTYHTAANGPVAGSFFGTHYVEVTNGANAGLLCDILSNTDTTLTLARNISSSVTAGASVIRIRPNWTFATVFGANNSAGLAGGPTATNADIIQLLHPQDGSSSLYFYDTTNNRWERLPGNSTDATNDVIPADSGLRIERKPGTSIAFQLVGAVKLGTTGLFVKGGNTPGNPQNLSILPNPYPLASKRFADLNLYTGAPGSWLGGATASSADTVSLYNTATGGFTTYFYNTSVNQWQHGPGQIDASNDVIPDGAALFIKRKTTNGDFTWFVPQPPMNLN